MNSKDTLNFPSGNFVLSDDAQIERVLARLGLLQIMSDPTGRPDGPTTRSLYHEGHPTHRLLIAIHTGHTQPESNGFHIFGFCRKALRADQARRLVDEVVGKPTLGAATTIVGMLPLPVID
jgi:hypothetical protein